MLNKLIGLIEEFNIITIFRHEYPDFDALGSQYALKELIEINFPNKKVYCLGLKSESQGAFFSYSDIISGETISNSLAIVLDTANGSRVDDQRYRQAKYIIKIDHHPENDPFGNLNIVDTSFAATSLLLTDIVYRQNLVLNEKVATYLYAGIISDTGRFLHSNTDIKCFKLSAYLLEKGANPAYVYNAMYTKTSGELKFTGFILDNFKIVGNVAYYILETQDYLSYGIDFDKAKEYIFSIAGIEGVKVWVSATFNSSTELYHVSLRSKSFVVNDFAAKYGGGGHPFASGIKVKGQDKLNLIINDLVAITG